MPPNNPPLVPQNAANKEAWKDTYYNEEGEAHREILAGNSNLDFAEDNLMEGHSLMGMADTFDMVEVLWESPCEEEVVRKGHIHQEDAWDAAVDRDGCLGFAWEMNVAKPLGGAVPFLSGHGGRLWRQP